MVSLQKLVLNWNASATTKHNELAENTERKMRRKKRFIGFVCMVLLLSMYSNHMNAVVGMPHSAYRNVKCSRCRVGVSVFVSIFCVAYAMFLCDVFCSDRWIDSECILGVCRSVELNQVKSIKNAIRWWIFKYVELGQSLDYLFMLVLRLY